MSKKHLVVSLSGGMDSTTLLYDLVSQQFELYLLSFNYGQRHKIELESAKRTAEKFVLPHKIIDLTSVNQVMEGSSLTRSHIDVPYGHYAEESMKVTIVPNRNMIMLSIATAYAVSLEAEAVYFAAHAGDHAIYPDCRQEFVDKLSEVTKIANYHPVEIRAPYLQMDKGDIAKRGVELGVDYSMTYTCYEGKELACGKCGACQERKEAFLKAEALDPIKYQD